MPGPLLHVGATVLCAHGGPGQTVSSNPRVLVSGQPVATVSDPTLVAGCVFTVSGAPQALRDGAVADARGAGARQRPARTAPDERRPLPERRSEPAGPDCRRRRAAARDRSLMQVAFPLRVDGRGRTAGADDDTHIRDLIEQVLFTAPGERVNRPDFGTRLAAARLRAEQRRAGDRDRAARPGRPRSAGSAM